MKIFALPSHARRDARKPQRNVHPVLRYGVAIIVAAIAASYGMNESGDFGMLAIIFFPAWVLLISGIAVGGCGFIGRGIGFRDFDRGSFPVFAAMLCVIALGVGLQIHGIRAKQLIPTGMTG